MFKSQVIDGAKIQNINDQNENTVYNNRLFGIDRK